MCIQLNKYTVYLSDWDNNDNAIHRCSANDPIEAELAAEAWAQKSLALDLEARFIVNGWHDNVKGQSVPDSSKAHRQWQNKYHQDSISAGGVL